MKKLKTNLNYSSQLVDYNIIHELGARSITYKETIQSLWSGYGEIIRCGVTGYKANTVIIKHVKVPEQIVHPRGWNTDTSHKRKIHSYHVEANWYRHWAPLLNVINIKNNKNTCRIPSPYFVHVSSNEFLFILEDLDAAGYPRRVENPSMLEMRLCLNWLADFHAAFMEQPKALNKVDKDKNTALWPIGTYWHLATRADELAALDDLPLREVANDIDATLNNCRYKTIVHGDAKLANFCFTKKNNQNTDNVAVLDFQYIGSGCGIKDVMLFLSSCLSSTQCQQYEQELLNYYFKCLKSALLNLGSTFDVEALEQEWRTLYPFAWADFVRFLKGWSPGHWKIHDYSESLTQMAIEQLNKNKPFKQA